MQKGGRYATEHSNQYLRLAGSAAQTQGNVIRQLAEHNYS